MGIREIGRSKEKLKNDAIKFSKYSEWKKYLDENYFEQKKEDDFFRFLRIVEYIRG